MAAGNKRGISIAFGMLGFAIMLLGLILLIVGNTAIGITNLASGMFFIIVGVAAARKATPPADSTGPNRR
jgi:hypothetical protein